MAVIMWAGDSSNLGGWGELMLWSSQCQNTDQGRVGPDWNVNMPAHDKGARNSAYTLLNNALIQGCNIDSEFLS